MIVLHFLTNHPNILCRQLPQYIDSTQSKQIEVDQSREGDRLFAVGGLLANKSGFLIVSTR